MANILDYLLWRGDLPLTVDPLNEVDLLIFSELIYVSFDGLLSTKGDMKTCVHVADVSHALLNYDPEAARIHQIGYLWAENRKMLATLPECARFASAAMTGYASETSVDAEQQFAAASFLLPGGEIVVAFRGTDDSLVGWKEDLNLSFASPVPAQRKAAEYLKAVAEAFEGEIWICGHSKGGNLAVYAAAVCNESLKARIRGVVSFDGPGQDERLVHSEGYTQIQKRIRLYVPHFSIVGMLLEHEKDYVVVKSDAHMLMQHNAFTWQVRGKHFEQEEAPSPQSQRASRVICEWIRTLSPDERRKFSEAIYEIALASDARTLTEMEKNWPLSALAVLRKLRRLAPEKWDMFRRTLGELLEIVRKSVQASWRNEEKIARNDLDAARLNQKADQSQADSSVRDRHSRPS